MAIVVSWITAILLMIGTIVFAILTNPSIWWILFALAVTAVPTTQAILVLVKKDNWLRKKMRKTVSEKELQEIEVVIPKMLDLDIHIVEDGKTPEENAIKKAKQYYDVTKIPTIAEDSGLYIDEFEENEQPGLFVRRIDGREDATDEEILNWYIDKLKKHGGESLAAYHTGVCIIDEMGKIYSETIKENKFLMKSEKNDLPTISGGVLDCISYDLINKKYFNERTEEERKIHFKELDTEYRKLVNKVLLEKDIDR